jgi:hypothetical protein
LRSAQLDPFMNSKDTQHATLARSWPTILNRFFIGIIVLALAFFVTGKALQMFRGDSTVVAEDSPDETDVSVEKTLVLISKDADMPGKMQELTDLETHFGKKIVFVSATVPAYVMTDDEQRFEIGAIPGTDVELSSISSTQLVLKRDEELLVYALPDATVN